MLNLPETSHQDSIKWELLDAIMKAIQLTANMKAKEELLSLPELTLVTIKPMDTTSLLLESKGQLNSKIIKKCILPWCLI